MRPRRLLGAAAGAAALAALAASAGSGPVDAAVCPDGPSTEEVTFTDVGTHQIKVPAGVQKVTVWARGGHGGEESHTAPGGRGGIAEATVVVHEGDCLTVHVGEYGYGHGGVGYGHGGLHGEQPGDGYDGAGGGGGSAVVDGSTALVVAGGGGGGGGQGASAHYHGGAGGDGAGGNGPGTRDGADGSTAPLVPAQYYLGGDGGAESGHDGGDGEDITYEIGPHLGAGGGGGGGYRGGSEGAFWGGDASPDDDFRSYGGGGGGGGDSYVVSGAYDVSYDVGPDPCSGDECNGRVTLRWVEKPYKVVPYGGAGQTATVTEGFVAPLQARVVSQSGLPVPGTTVTFTLPSTPPSGTFDDAGAGTTATAVTGLDGVATSPWMTAGSTAGPWTATATVAEVDAPGRFPLRTNPASTATALWSSSQPAIVGQEVRFAAQVRGIPATAPAPSGTVEFRVDGQAIGDPVELDAAGTAQSPPTAMQIGSHDVTAVYSGDASNGASEGALTQEVGQAEALVRVTSSANPSAALAPVTFTAEVTTVPPGSGVPTGTVAFFVDDVALGAPVALDGAGRATSAPASALAPGPHTVRVDYGGDAGRQGASGTFEQDVGDGASATSLAVTPDPATFGQTATAVATVRGDGGGTPTGSVRFRVDGELECDGVELDPSGVAACALPDDLAAGTHAVVAQYGGDDDFGGSQGTLAHAVAPSATTIAVEATPDPAVVGTGLRLHADVAPVAPGSGTPTGGVRFRVDGAVVGGLVTLGPDGADSAVVSDLGAGPHVIEASYTGDGDFAAGDRRAVALVARALTTATATSSANPSTEGETVAFEAVIAPVAPGGGQPGGTVELWIDGQAHSDVVAVGGAGAVRLSSTRALAVGDHDVRITYSGSRDWGPSEATLVQTVVPGPPGGGGGGSGGSSSTPPAVPGAPIPLVPPTEDVAEDCGHPIELTTVRRAGRRVALGGLALPRYAGRRVTLRAERRGRTARSVGQAWVRDDGTFATRTGARHRPHAGARYTATVAGHRSAARRMARRLVVAESPSPDRRRVRITGHVAGDGRRALVFERLVGCARDDVDRVRTLRTNRRGRFALTLARPPAGSPLAVYRVRAARGNPVSQPIVVRATR